MARAGRKQLAVQIKEESFTALEQIKQETGLSNAKVIEMLIENYSGTNINTNTNTGITEEQLRKILKEELSGINTNTSTNTKKTSKPKTTNTNTNTNTNTKEILLDENECGPGNTSIDDTPEWQRKELTAQDFYGKLPKPYEKGEFDHDPQRYLDALDEEPAPKPKKEEEEKPFNPFL